MQLFLSWKNLCAKPLQTALTVLLMTLGVGLATFLLLFNHQVEQKFGKNLAGIDLIMGAKGSPLQLVLASLFHVDAPTGNIAVQDIKGFLREPHPFIAKSIPLSLGDNYKGYRLVGTTHEFFAAYQATLAQGKLFDRSRAVVAGAAVAEKLHLHIGDTFKSSHGLIDDGNDMATHEDEFTIVGILQPTGAIIDALLVTSTSSLWDIHNHAAHTPADPAAPQADDHDHHHTHDHTHDHAVPVDTSLHITDTTLVIDNAGLLTHLDKDITALLLQFKGRNMQTLNLQRNINENTGLQAATPALEINRLYALMGTGTDALQWLAIIIMIVSGLSVFIALYTSLKERQYELALIRTLGGSRWTVFSLILVEGLLLTVLGLVLGILAGHIAISWLSNYLYTAYRYQLTGRIWLTAEYYLLLAGIAIGLLAALLPAYSAYRTDIAKTLAK